MDFDLARKSVLDWVETFVEKSNPGLNGWPPCPFARRARLEDKFHIREGSDFLTDAMEVVDNWDDTYDVIACVYDRSAFTVESLAEKVHHFNKKISLPRDILLLEDHPDDSEVVNNVILNQGTYILILFQRFSKVNDASVELKEKGYYNIWPSEYYDRVVGWREQYVFGDD